MPAKPALPYPLETLPTLLEAAISPERLRLLRAIGAFAYHEGQAIYLVGGAPRDLLLGLPSPDLDLVLEGAAPALAAGLAARFGGKVLVHSRFGTAKWTPPDSEALDLVSARSEAYSRPGALPAVQTGTIIQDLARRDFSINTLAMRLDGPHYGEILDPWQGYPDLQAGVIRVLHEASFTDDPTRILRAARFAARFGYRLEAGSAALIGPALAAIPAISGKRLRHELDLILAEPSAPAALQLLQDHLVLAAIHPLLAWSAADLTRWEAAQPGQLSLAQRYALWLLPLDADTLQSITRRLSLDRATAQLVLQAAELNRCWPELLSPQRSVRTRNLTTFSLPSLELMRQLHAGTPQESAWRDHLEAARFIRPFTTGKRLQALGLNPGPRYQQILERLKDAWLDGELQNEQAEETLLRSMLRDGQ